MAVALLLLSQHEQHTAPRRLLRRLEARLGRAVVLPKNWRKLRYVTTGNELLWATIGGIAPNEVIARSEFEVHRQMFTE